MQTLAINHSDYIRAKPKKTIYIHINIYINKYICINNRSKRGEKIEYKIQDVVDIACFCSCHVLQTYTNTLTCTRGRACAYAYTN